MSAKSSTNAQRISSVPWVPLKRNFLQEEINDVQRYEFKHASGRAFELYKNEADQYCTHERIPTNPYSKVSNSVGSENKKNPALTNWVENKFFDIDTQPPSVVFQIIQENNLQDRVDCSLQYSIHEPVLYCSIHDANKAIWDAIERDEWYIGYHESPHDLPKLFLSAMVSMLESVNQHIAAFEYSNAKAPAQFKGVLLASEAVVTDSDVIPLLMAFRNAPCQETWKAVANSPIAADGTSGSQLWRHFDAHAPKPAVTKKEKRDGSYSRFPNPTELFDWIRQYAADTLERYYGERADVKDKIAAYYEKYGH